MKTQAVGFLKAFKKVKTGKKKLSDQDFIKYRSSGANNLNSLGKFFFDKKVATQELKTIAKQFNRKTYTLDKYTCVILPKGVGGHRPILVPAPKDRIIFSYILEKIRKEFLKEINKHKVFGSGKRVDFPNTKKIIEEIQKESKRHKYILKLDICKFFPSINQKILFRKIKKYIKDPYIFKVIKKSFNNKIEPRFTKNFSKEEQSKIIPSLGEGIPQGCAYSPLLANFYALDLDKTAKDSGYVSFRYLDDMVIFMESEKEANDFFKKINLVSKKINLKIYDVSKKSNNKTYIQPTNYTFGYLGIEIKSNGTLQIPIDKIKKELHLIKTGIFNNITIKRFGAHNVVKVLDSQFNGWKRYYQNNFPSAYLSIQNKDFYNKNLKKYYGKIIRNKGESLKNEFLLAGFDINNSKFYF